MHRRSSMLQLLCGPLGLIFWMGIPSCSTAGINWDEAWEVKVNGQRLTVELFTTRMPPDVASRELARRNSGYERYLIAEGRILLSGVADGRHWLAQVQSHAGGAQGYVSALYFDHAAAPGKSSKAVRNEAARLRRISPGTPTLVHKFQFGESASVGLMSVPQHVAKGRFEGVSKVEHRDGANVISLASHPTMAVAITMEP